MNITVKLTKAQALAILKSDGFKQVHCGHAYTNKNLDEASSRIFDAIRQARRNDAKD